MDALRALADEDAGKSSRLARLFGNRTQGLRYHTLIVAVATLIENRLPGLALACGDFDKQDADRACDELARIFGERFDRPVLLDPDRIQMRISEPETALLLSRRHTHEVIPEVAALFKRLYARMHVAIVTDLEENSLICTDSDSLCDDTRMAFAMLGFRLAELSPHLESLPASAVTEQLMLQSIAAGTQHQNLLLTDIAWDSIEATDLKTREFLYRLCQLKCDRLEMHQMLLAIYENPVVRDFVMSVWRAELDRPSTLLQSGQLPLN